VIVLCCENLTYSNSRSFPLPALRLLRLSIFLIHIPLVLSCNISYRLSTPALLCTSNFTAVLAAPLPFSPSEKGGVRALAVQVSALSKDLFVFLRLYFHHPSTLLIHLPTPLRPATSFPLSADCKRTLRITACCSASHISLSAHLFFSGNTRIFTITFSLVYGEAFLSGSSKPHSLRFICS